MSLSDQVNSKQISKAPKPNIFSGNISDHVKLKLLDQDDDVTPSENIDEGTQIDPKVVQLFTLVGKSLSEYNNGPLPKAIKAIPSIENWEEILELTNPFKWTPYAVQKITSIFASSWNSKTVEIYYQNYLLPIVRENISQNKKLNLRLFLALKKATYKPAAFYKAILLPLLKNNCTLKESRMITGVISKCSIPALHSAAAIMLILNLKLSGSLLTVLRGFINKKYSLPVSVVKRIINFFVEFKDDQMSLPVLWHHCLLDFVMTYKTSFSNEDKSNLKTLISKQTYKGISEEIIAQINSID